jgi:MtaA/CmuA family methyltransferase
MPITMMFACDIIGVAYRDYANDHRVLAAAQLETAAKFGFDYVSVISDPAREASDLGGVVEWFEDQPPAIVESRALLEDKLKLQTLELPDPAAGRMRDRVDGVRLLAREAGDRLMVEGWVEGPCAMGADLRGVNALMLDFIDDPPFVTELFEFVVAMELRFARAQIEAGATLIGIGDAAASLVGPRLYGRFVLPFECRLIHGVREMGARVRLHICGNTRKIAAGMGTTGADMIDLDFLTPMAEARSAIPEPKVLAGNLDPVRVVRDGTPEQIRAAIADCHRAAGNAYVACAGCEIPRGTPEANLRAMAEYAKSHN